MRIYFIIDDNYNDFLFLLNEINEKIREEYKLLKFIEDYLKKKKEYISIREWEMIYIIVFIMFMIYFFIYMVKF